MDQALKMNEAAIIKRWLDVKSLSPDRIGVLLDGNDMPIGFGVVPLSGTIADLGMVVFCESLDDVEKVLLRSITHTV